MLFTQKQELLRLHRPLTTSVLSYAQTIDAQQKLVQELTPEFVRCSPHQLGAELRERLVLVDHVFLALDTEIRDCVGRAECFVHEILRISREAPKLEEAARSEEDRGCRLGASYFVASKNEDDEPVRSSDSSFSRPNSTGSSGATLSKTISPSVTYLGSTYEYSESSVIATLLGSVVQSRGGTNKFQKYVADRSSFGSRNSSPHPNNCKKDSTSRSQVAGNERFIRKEIQDATGSSCSRCFRSERPGSTDGTWQNSVCADPKEDLFVPIPICRVLKDILQFVLFSNKTSYNAAVKSFYAAKGIDFGENTSDTIENVVLGVNSALPYTFGIRSPNRYSQEGTLHSFLFRAPPSSARSLASIPDTGNPKMAVGKPWWDDYSLLLEEAGLLNDVRYASFSESFGFGDGPSSPPLFVAIQVPLFHRLKTGEILLVFADVKIINHAGGLLDGKEDLQAMQLTSH
jgi:hypothetical protein